MASIIARRAFSTSARRLTTGEEALKSESKKNPEIMVRQFPRQSPALCSSRLPDSVARWETQLCCLSGCLDWEVESDRKLTAM
jgi:hypothetical protein